MGNWHKTGGKMRRGMKLATPPHSGWGRYPQQGASQRSFWWNFTLEPWKQNWSECEEVLRRTSLCWLCSIIMIFLQFWSTFLRTKPWRVIGEDANRNGGNRVDRSAICYQLPTFFMLNLVKACGVLVAEIIKNEKCQELVIIPTYFLRPFLCIKIGLDKSSLNWEMDLIMDVIVSL